MLMEFVSQNLFWVAAFVIVANLLLWSFVQTAVPGATAISALEMPRLQRGNRWSLIDVSDAKDFATGHLPGAVNIPLAELNKPDSGIDKHKKKTVILSCRTGASSIKAAKLLVSMGFEDVHYLKDGLIGWKKENLPVVIEK